MVFRPETPSDALAIRHIHDEAFGQPQEGELLEQLRANGRLVLSLLAEVEGEPVAHVAFFRVEIHGENTHGEAQKNTALGLGPMAVLPEFQQQGIGTALALDALDRLKKGGHSAVIVLGHPNFYGDLGFETASFFGIRTSYEVPDEVFMAMELTEGGLDGKSGTVVYSKEFDVF